MGHVNVSYFTKICANRLRRCGFIIPVWPSLVVASSLPAPGLCHVTEPSTSHSQLGSAHRAKERERETYQSRSVTINSIIIKAIGENVNLK